MCVCVCTNINNKSQYERFKTYFTRERIIIRARVVFFLFLFFTNNKIGREREREKNEELLLLLMIYTNSLCAKRPYAGDTFYTSSRKKKKTVFYRSLSYIVPSSHGDT